MKFQGANYEVRKRRKDERRSFLDPNHTHLLLVDNGTTEQYSTEIELRGKLEAEIGKVRFSALQKTGLFYVLTIFWYSFELRITKR